MSLFFVSKIQLAIILERHEQKKIFIDFRSTPSLYNKPFSVWSLTNHKRVALMPRYANYSRLENPWVESTNYRIIPSVAPLLEALKNLLFFYCVLHKRGCKKQGRGWLLFLMLYDEISVGEL